MSLKLAETTLSYQRKRDFVSLDSRLCGNDNWSDLIR